MKSACSGLAAIYKDVDEGTGPQRMSESDGMAPFDEAPEALRSLFGSLQDANLMFSDGGTVSFYVDPTNTPDNVPTISAGVVAIGESLLQRCAVPGTEVGGML